MVRDVAPFFSGSERCALHLLDSIPALPYFSSSERTELWSSLEADIEDCIFERFSKGNCQYLSLDVFDTLLFRKNASEARRFHDLCAELARDIEGNDTEDAALNILLARIEGMRFSYRTRKSVDGCREGSIREVIKYMALRRGWSETDQEKALQVEVNFEQRSLVPNQSLINIAKKLQKNGAEIILVSDMYLHSDSLENLVSGLGVDLNLFRNIYSSADTVVSKHSGLIFPKIERDLGAVGSGFLHIGDSHNGDYVMAKKYGWDALHVPIPYSEMLQRMACLRATIRDLQPKVPKGVINDWAKI